MEEPYSTHTSLPTVLHSQDTSPAEAEPPFRPRRWRRSNCALHTISGHKVILPRYYTRECMKLALYTRTRYPAPIQPKMCACVHPGCVKQFADEASLKKHVSLAHGMTSFLCHMCRQRFADRLTLTRHQMDKHPEGRQRSKAQTPKKPASIKAVTED